MRSSAPATAFLFLLACGNSSPPSNTPSDAGRADLVFPTGCTNPVNDSSATAGVTHLGALAAGTDAPFLVTTGTASVTIIQQAVHAPISVDVKSGGSTFRIDNTAVPFLVKDPAGSVIFDDNQPLPEDLSTLTAYFASSSPGTGTLTIPNTTSGLSLVGSAGLPAGTWSLRVSDYAYECAVIQPTSSLDCSASGDSSSVYDVTVLTKPMAGGIIPPTGTLDVAFYFATSSAPGPAGQAPLPLTAANASAGSDRDLNRMVSTLRAIFGAAGITLNDPTYHDLPQAVQAAYSTGVDVNQGGACAQLPQLLKNAEPGNTLNIFLVPRFKPPPDLPADTLLVGIDGTIPGPSSVGGTVASGAAVAVGDLRSGRSGCTGSPNFVACGADVTAHVVAHEAGHFLGLYHTTEQQGLDFDALSDTARCSCASCATLAAGEVCSASPPSGKQTHVVGGSECAGPTAKSGCGGADNLMFWILDDGASAALTAQQKMVMLANPLLH